MLKKAVTPGSFLKNYLFTLLIVFLPLFMFGVFGPSEIFFGNYSEFGFIYREFGWKFLGISVVLALFIALILQIVPKFPRTLIQKKIFYPAARCDKRYSSWNSGCRICVFISYSRCFCNGLQ